MILRNVLSDNVESLHGPAKSGAIKEDEKVLLYIALFLVTLIISTIVVWVYRLVSHWSGFKQSLVSDPDTESRRILKAQKGFISLFSLSSESAKHKMLRSPKGGLKTPWGW